MNPLNAKVIQNQLIQVAQVVIPSHISINNTNGVSCPHGHQLAPQSSYVSFRLAAALPNTHSWGLYISQQDIDNLATALVNHGWNPSDSTEHAKNLITAGLRAIFHLDCTLMSVHEILFLQFGPLAYSNGLNDVLAPSWDLFHNHSANGIIYSKNSFTGDDDDWYSLHSHLGISHHPSSRGSLDFTRSVIENMIRGKIIFSSQAACQRFILNLPIYNDRKPFPGIELPITIIP